MSMVRKAQAHGCIVGSSSDRPLPVQQAIWDRHRIEVSFISHKQELPNVKERLAADEYYHIGDTELDRQFALEAGFNFLWMDAGLQSRGSTWRRTKIRAPGYNQRQPQRRTT